MGFVACIPKALPDDIQLDAMADAAQINPANMVPAFGLIEPGRLGLLRSKQWASTGVNHTVQFLDNPDRATRNLILQHANLWGKKANVKFSETNSGGNVRIARERDGYWSYLGTDTRQIPMGQPTMNLEGFTSRTPLSEYMRVVPHEFGHHLGFPHEHMRAEIIARLDRNKTYAWARSTIGWSKQMVDSQIFAALSELALSVKTLHARDNSIMCYSFPGSITKDGKPIVGGNQIDILDYDVARKAYPQSL